MATIRIETDVPLHLADGTVLRADIYRPDVATRVPVLVQRTPYGKGRTPLVNIALDVMRAVANGYAVVVQDVRGTGASDGCFAPYRDEGNDGSELVAFLASQAWSSGRVGMAGGSYVASTQWLAACHAADSLKAFAPFLGSPDPYHDLIYPGGAFALGLSLTWVTQILAVGELARQERRGKDVAQRLRQAVDTADRVEDLFWRLPMSALHELEDVAPYYADWLAHPDYDGYWQALFEPGGYETVQAPALIICGWYDFFLAGSLTAFRRLRAGAPGGPGASQLIIGPWSHGVLAGAFEERSFGMRSGVDALDLTSAQLRWFDRWLKEGQAPQEDAPVRYFLMGADEWRSAEKWPPPDATPQVLYLHSGGNANTRDGDGKLSRDEPGFGPDDIYLYNPRNPVPTRGGANLLPGYWIAARGGPRDQRPVEMRQDVLCYTTEPVSIAFDIVGDVRLLLYVSSSARDTDFTAKLVDVGPGGRAEIITDGILRARYRNSTALPSLLQPGNVYEITVDMGATATRIAVGHRVRLEVSSSNFPKYGRNSNTGGKIALESDDELIPAVNRVHHCRDAASRLAISVIGA